MIRDSSPSAESVRVVENTAPFSDTQTCTDDSCFETTSSMATETLLALRETISVIRVHMDTLQHYKSRSQTGPDSTFMQIREEAVHTLTLFGGDTDISYILDGEINADTLHEFYDALTMTESLPTHEEQSIYVPPDEKEMLSAWNGLFVKVLLARFYMMQLAVQDPYDFRTTFNQPTLAQTPKDKNSARENEALKLVVAQDIARGREKSIVLRMQSDPEIRAYDGQSELSVYMQEYPNAQVKVREYIRCIAVGVQAMGGNMCERLPSQNGLCKRNADDVDLSLFPPLEKIVLSTLENARTQAVAGCEGWEHSMRAKFPRIYDPTYDPVEQQVTKSVRAPRESVVVSKKAARQRDRSGDEVRETTEARELEQSRLQRVVVRALGGEPMDINLRAGDDGEFDLVVKQLMSHDIIQDYLSDYDNNPGLVRFLEKAIRALLLPDENSSRSIEQLRKVRSVNVDGISEKPYRLSGAKLPGAGGGRIAEVTRVLFSARNVGDTRAVTLRGVVHRSDNRYGEPKDFQQRYYY